MHDKKRLFGYFCSGVSKPIQYIKRRGKGFSFFFHDGSSFGRMYGKKVRRRRLHVLKNGRKGRPYAHGARTCHAGRNQPEAKSRDPFGHVPCGKQVRAFCRRCMRGFPGRTRKFPKSLRENVQRILRKAGLFFIIDEKASVRWEEHHERYYTTVCAGGYSEE